MWCLERAGPSCWQKELRVRGGRKPTTGQGYVLHNVCGQRNHCNVVSVLSKAPSTTAQAPPLAAGKPSRPAGESHRGTQGLHSFRQLHTKSLWINQELNSNLFYPFLCFDKVSMKHCHILSKLPWPATGNTETLTFLSFCNLTLEIKI